MHICRICRHTVTHVGYRCGCGHYWDEDRLAGVGVDVSDGDVVMNLGDGLGIDLATGELELEVAPGIDIPLGDGLGW